MNKRLVALCLLCCLATGTVACAQTRAPAPSPGSPVTVPATPSPGAAEMSSGTAETSVVTSYYRAVVAGNYRLAFAFLDADAVGSDGQRMTLSAFLQLAQSMDGAEGPVTDFSVSAIESMIVMTNYRKRMGPYHAHLQMRQEGNGWKIVSLDRI